VPDAAGLATGEAVLKAEAAMRRAIGELGEKPDPAAAQKAMRAAGEELQRAANPPHPGTNTTSISPHSNVNQRRVPTALPRSR
jgi:hypothetical protein